MASPLRKYHEPRIQEQESLRCAAVLGAEELFERRVRYRKQNKRGFESSAATKVIENTHQVYLFWGRV